MRSRRRLEEARLELRELRQELARERQRLRDGVEANGGLAPTRTQAKYEAELEDLAQRLEAVKTSESYRIGHAIVRVVRYPLRALRALRSRLRRAAPKGRTGSGPSATESPGRRAGAYPIPEGSHLLGPLNDNHSVTLFLLWGCDADEIESLTAEVARLQLMLRDFKPVFVTDSDFWSPFRHYGYWFEYIPSAAEWMRHNEPTEWPDYVGERIDSIIGTYQPDRIVAWEGGAEGGALRTGVLDRIVSAAPSQIEAPALPPRPSAGG